MMRQKISKIRGKEGNWQILKRFSSMENKNNSQHEKVRNSLHKIFWTENIMSSVFRTQLCSSQGCIHGLVSKNMISIKGGKLRNYLKFVAILLKSDVFLCIQEEKMSSHQCSS